MPGMEELSSRVSFDDVSTITFIENTANENGGALAGVYYSSILFMGNLTTIFQKNKATKEGGAVHCGLHCNILFNDNSNITFSDNSAVKGGAVGIRDHSKLLISSTVKFYNNRAVQNGGALLIDSSIMIFKGYSKVQFHHNVATSYGGAVFSNSKCNILFHENTTVKFYDNIAAQDGGGALYIRTNSFLTFQGYAIVSFASNTAKEGGAIMGFPNNRASFDEHSIVTFTDNTAIRGGAVSWHVAHILFQGNSTIMFKKNKATSGAGGALLCHNQCSVLFNGDSNITFNENSAREGGAVGTTYSKLSISGSSLVTFTNNNAIDGGAVYCAHNSISFHKNATVKFYKNRAAQFGGAVHNRENSKVMFLGNSFISFINNNARYGGAIHSHANSRVSFDNFSMIAFIKNNGGALTGVHYSSISFMKNSTIIFQKNKATTSEGGAVNCNDHSNILFDDYSNVTFSDNSAVGGGGAVNTGSNSKLLITGSSLLTFTNNNAIIGGAIQCTIQSSIIFDGNTIVTFTDNTALRYGGAIYIDNSDVTLKGKSKLTIIKNSALYGGAIHTSESSFITFEGSSVTLAYNAATENGDTLHLSDNFLLVFSYGSSITFDGNIADRYGGAIYAEVANMSIAMNLNTTGIYFCNNTAPFGNNIYVHVPSSCDDLCLNNSIIVGTAVTSSGQRQFVDYISTSPNKLVLYKPATCIDDDDHTICEAYIVKNIMLGQKIAVNGCVWDYYNKQAIATQFSVSSSDQAHHISDSDYVLISCDVLQGLNLIGDKVTKPENVSVSFASHSDSQSDLKTISVQLMVELSPCHPGFHYDDTAQRCICYSDNDIISCIDSKSIIKEGYWFGVVDGKATMTICPSSYCNFTCCKTTNEFYQLSPARINQCLSHRCGTACGSCEEGYTLSFDSIDCVSVKKCTTGQTSLVVTLSMIYWIVIVILVFIMTYYHAGISYLYAITYYYSVVDILLGERLYTSTGLFTTVSIMSSIAKITPQFLGQLCFVKNLSGIDQQFMHYAHPLAVTIIVGIICLSTRVSYRISAFVSKGIIRVICFLLLVSYTSVATTSLLLLRSLTFHNVDKVYSYLSPNIEYFHGRHLPYVIIAILCTLLIVIGLPLLLLLEPFLNHKINFIRFKPLLDQFQGCYKDKYRSFAAYYMICRLVVIVIIIVNSSNDSTTQYQLITVNSILSLVHVLIKPYARRLLNMFDSLILQLLIVVSMIPLVDSSDPDLFLTFIIIVVILPLIAFLIMEMYLYKSTIKKITEYCRPPKPDTTNDNNEIPMRDFVDSVIDDNSRRNATICEM